MWLSSFIYEVFKIHSVFLHVLEIHLFYWWIIFHCKNISYFVYPCQFMGIWAVSTFWLLWRRLIWTFLCKFLCGHAFIYVEFVFSSSIAGSYDISRTVHGVIKTRMLKWFAISFSSVPHFVRILHRDSSVLGGLTWHGS